MASGKTKRLERALERLDDVEARLERLEVVEARLERLEAVVASNRVGRVWRRRLK